MTVRIFKHDRNELLKQGIEIIPSTNDTKYPGRTHERPNLYPMNLRILL